MHPIPQVSKNELAAGEEVEVTLKGTGFLTMEPFMGFLIQVQPPSSKQITFPCCCNCCALCRCEMLKLTALWVLSSSRMGRGQNICNATQLRTASLTFELMRKLWWRPFGGRGLIWLGRLFENFLKIRRMKKGWCVQKNFCLTDVRHCNRPEGLQQLLGRL